MLAAQNSRFPDLKRDFTASTLSASARAERTLSDPLALLAIFALWVFCNPCYATNASSVVYTARALADLYPSSVGQDIAFRYDGQSIYTIFTPVLSAINAWFGMSAATMIAAAIAVFSSFSAAGLLASTMVAGRARYLLIIFAAALPAYYGGYHLFAYSEAAATPRPLAEALVYCGFVALLGKKNWLAFAFMIGAALLHPIMSLAGFAVLFLYIVPDDRRWLFVALALMAGVIVAAMFGVEPFNRLTTIIDPEWREVLITRNPHLFASTWPPDWMGRVATRMATLLIASSLIRPELRRLFLACLMAGFVGIAASYLLGDKLSMLIVLQAQTWRMLWVVFALGTMAGAICVIELWPRGGMSRIVLALLALGWVTANLGEVAVLIAVSAVLLHYSTGLQKHRISEAPLWSVLAIFALFIVFGVVRQQMDFLQMTVGAPTGLVIDAHRTLAIPYDYTFVALLAGAWWIAGKPRPSRRVLTAATALGLFVALYSWDQRSLANKHLDSGDGVPDLEQIVATRPGEVYWVDGARETWWWLRRPSWISALQGASIVFSRDLAMVFKDRAQRAKELGFSTEDIATLPKEFAPGERSGVTREKLDRFCSAKDAPAWIVAPLGDGVRYAPDISGVEWEPPVEILDQHEENEIFIWRRLSKYLVIPCAEVPTGSKS